MARNNLDEGKGKSVMKSCNCAVVLIKTIRLLLHWILPVLRYRLCRLY